MLAFVGRKWLATISCGLSADSPMSARRLPHAVGMRAWLRPAAPAGGADGGQRRAAAERTVAGALSGPGRQGARPALRPQDRRAAMAGLGDHVGAHRLLRRPQADAADPR